MDQSWDANDHAPRRRLSKILSSPTTFIPFSQYTFPQVRPELKVRTTSTSREERHGRGGQQKESRPPTLSLTHTHTLAPIPSPLPGPPGPPGTVNGTDPGPPGPPGELQKNVSGKSCIAMTRPLFGNESSAEVATPGRLGPAGQARPSGASFHLFRLTHPRLTCPQPSHLHIPGPIGPEGPPGPPGTGNSTDPGPPGPPGKLNETTF